MNRPAPRRPPRPAPRARQAEVRPDAGVTLIYDPEPDPKALDELAELLVRLLDRRAGR